MGWEHPDLPGHEGYPGSRLAADLGPDSPWPGSAGDVVAYTDPHVLEAGVDAMVPACACGWQGAPIPIDSIDDVDQLWDRANREWLAEHAAGLLSAVPPADLDRDLAAVLDRVAQLGADRPLAALVLLRQMASTTDALAHDTARNARRARATWEQIGAMLGVSRQAAAERFGPTVRRAPMIYPG